MNKSLPLAIYAGVGAAIIGAALWAAITLVTNFQIGFMAVGVGLLCGYAVGKFGRGSGPLFGVIGGASALLGCLLGNLWSAFGAIAHVDEVSFWSVMFGFDYSLTFELLSAAFDPIDLLFYAIAVFEGFKFGSADRAQEQAATVTTD